MPATSACPGALEWQRLLLGQLSDLDASTLEQHLEQCFPCQQSLQKVDIPDGLLQTVRAVAGRPVTVLPGVVDHLIDHLVRLSGSTTSADQEAGEKAPAEAAQELESLLAPPQDAGEIGRLGPYRVLGVLGSGGMGVVFRAEDPQLGRLVALKVIRPRLAASATARIRFQREARTAAAVEHDHIVPIYQVGEDRGVPFLAFPLLRGETLEDRLRREEKLPVAEILRIGREIAEGLAAAHARGLIHRDIKPSNLWLEAAGPEPGPASGPKPTVAGRRVKILDFGLARAVAEVQEKPEETDLPSASASLTQTGAVLGTPAYMAPEQARGDEVDGRADLFSLGAVLYRMATGRVPFPGTDLTAVLTSLESDRPTPPRLVNPRVPAPLSRLILQLLAREAAERPSSAQAVAERLTALAKRGRHRWGMITGAVLLAGLLAIVASWSRPSRQDRQVPEEEPAEAAVAEVQFVPAASYDTGLNPQRMAAGDLNDDGNLDLVVANMGVRSGRIEEHTRSTVSVFLGQGDGSFRLSGHFPVGIQPGGVLIADLDSDGKPDLVVANMSGHDVSVLRGHGDGTFQSAVHYPAGKHPHQIVAADFNGDGKLDIAAGAAFHHGGASLLLGNGDGSLRPPVFYATGANSGSVVSGDFNSDGKADLAVVNFTSDTVTLLLGKGDGTFRPTMNHRIQGPLFAAEADFDEDGKLDLVVAVNRAPGLQVLLGRGDGTFRVGPGLEGGPRAVVADFNGDGKADLVTADAPQSDGANLLLHLGKGGGTFRSSPPRRLGFRPMQFAAGDFNRDGRPDLAVSVEGNNKVWVLLNRPVVHRLTVSNHEVPVGQATFLLITAQDATGGTAAGYTGTVRITCDGEQKGLPAEYTFTDRDKGAHPFDPVVFSKPGRYTVTIADLANPDLTATGTVHVLPRQP